MKKSLMLVSSISVLVFTLTGIKVTTTIDQKSVLLMEPVTKNHSGVTQEKGINWDDVRRVFNKGNLQDDVFRITFPRSDLQVK